MGTTKRKMAADGRQQKKRSIPEPAAGKVKKNSGPDSERIIRRSKPPLRTGQPVKSGE